MADVKWIKLTTGMFDNRKIKHIRKLPEGNNIVLIWVMLLTMAGRCNAGGYIFLTENIPYTNKMLADELGFDESVICLAIATFEQFDMIHRDGDLLAIPGWEEYQNVDGLDKVRKQTRERVAAHRARQKEAKKALECTSAQLPCEKKEQKAKKKTEPKQYYPDEQLNQAFLDYLDMRKKIRKPATERAISLAMNKLKTLSTLPFSDYMDNDLAIRILEQSTLNSWQGLFPLKGDGKSQDGTNWDKV